MVSTPGVDSGAVLAMNDLAFLLLPVVAIGYPLW